MGERGSLESVQSKYNRACARITDLEQQSTEKQKKWRELETGYKTNEALTRELCSLILAKDPKEMVLGAEYSWGKLPTDEIIRKAKAAYTKYNEDRTQLLKLVQRQSEERRLENESLRTQIEQIMRERRNLQNLRRTDDDEGEAVTADPETGEIIELPKPVQEPSEQAKRRAALNIQEAAERGSIDVVAFDESDETSVAAVPSPSSQPTITQEDIRRGELRQPGRAATTRRTPLSVEVKESNSEVSNADIDRRAEMGETAVEIALGQSGAKITPAQKAVNAVAARKKNAEMMVVQVDAADIEKKMNQRRWAILEVIGSTGTCESSDIVAKTIEKLKQSGEDAPTSNGLRYELMNMVNNSCLTMEKVAHPVKSRFFVYSLSDIGRRLYIAHFHTDPVVSERDLLIADHDNLEHAFGIKTLKQILEDSGNYGDISMDRRTNTIKLNDGTFYIPDITAKCRWKNRTFTAYIEYERGTHHQSDFNVKLNKAVKVTKHVDIVAPNGAVVEILKEKVAAWLESRGGGKNLPNVRVRLTSLQRLKDKTDINDDDNWQVVFDLKHGDVPIER